MFLDVPHFARFGGMTIQYSPSQGQGRRLEAVQCQDLVDALGVHALGGADTWKVRSCYRGHWSWTGSFLRRFGTWDDEYVLRYLRFYWSKFHKTWKVLGWLFKQELPTCRRFRMSWAIEVQWRKAVTLMDSIWIDWLMRGFEKQHMQTQQEQNRTFKTNKHDT